MYLLDQFAAGKSGADCAISLVVLSWRGQHDACSQRSSPNLYLVMPPKYDSVTRNVRLLFTTPLAATLAHQFLAQRSDPASRSAGRTRRSPFRFACARVDTPVAELGTKSKTNRQAPRNHVPLREGSGRMSQVLEKISLTPSCASLRDLTPDFQLCPPTQTSACRHPRGATGDRGRDRPFPRAAATGWEATLERGHVRGAR